MLRLRGDDGEVSRGQAPSRYDGYGPSSRGPGVTTMQLFQRRHVQFPPPEHVLRGRDQRMPVPDRHLVLGTPLVGPWPEGCRPASFGMGCFWGAEKFLWNVPGVYSTFVGYQGGITPNPTYDEVCSGRTAHAEVAVAVYHPAAVAYDSLLKVFWENHDPTQGNRQGNDVGTAYRSAIYWTTPEQESAAIALAQAVLAEVAPDAMDTMPEEGEGAGARYEKLINIKDRGQIFRVDVDSIERIEAAGDYMCIYTADNSLILRETMKDLERRLDPRVFQRVHRSWIVNLNNVRQVKPHTNGECFLILESGADVKVSRSYRDVVARFVH